jgi:hypothetical protein
MEGRIVRGHQADRPQARRELSEIGSRTSSSAPLIMDRPPNTCGLFARRVEHPHSPCGLSAEHQAIKNTRTNGSKRSDGRTRGEHDEHPAAELLTDRSRLPSGLSPHADRAARARNRKHQNTYPSMDLQNNFNS